MAAQQTTILIVEDEPTTREVMTRYLEQAGFATRWASSGEEALHILREEGSGIDWLFTDVNLPGCIDGWAVGAEFHLSYPLRPVIYTSACAPGSRSYIGGGEYVPKPYSPARIVKVIQQFTAQDVSCDLRTPAERLSDLLRRDREVA